MDADDEETGCTPIPPRRARGIDFVLLPVLLFREIVGALDSVLESLVGVLAGHANYLTDQRNFSDGVRKELENLPTAEE